MIRAAHAASEQRTEESEQITRIQVFLDRAGFGPGKIDGRDGEFTRRALDLYRTSQGQDAIPGESLDPAGLDLSSADPVFITYTVTEEDVKNVGEVPETVPAQAKLKELPYHTAAEAIAEKFHCDADFLEERNSGKTAGIKVGDQLSVPNVIPFELEVLKRAQPTNKQGDTPTMISVVVNTKSNMAEVYDDSKIIAAFPVSIGASETGTPTGEWKVRGVARMPEFRHDEKMLNEGERSEEFHMLPPGPNNPVGVMWIALNRDGIGLHGTNNPDLIGRSESHGCIRLANWDVVRLAEKIKPGTAVSIR